MISTKYQSDNHFARKVLEKRGQYRWSILRTPRQNSYISSVLKRGAVQISYCASVSLRICREKLRKSSRCSVIIQ